MNTMELIKKGKIKFTKKEIKTSMEYFTSGFGRQPELEELAYDIMRRREKKKPKELTLSEWIIEMGK